VEITVECNPTSLDHAGADALFAEGVNRLSIGTQSLDVEELRYLGRLHDPEGALAALRGALTSRIPRVSADLIFGLPEQPVSRGRDQALALADLGLRHLSCYQLTIEPGTRFGELARAGRLPMADDARVGEAFLLLDEALSARGFRHYEISNYALPGEEARHNLGYWRGEEYLGLGCGAFGFLRTGSGGVRYRNEIDPDAYLRHAGVPTKDEEALDALTLLRERIMLGLRLETGFDLAGSAGDLGLDPFTPERTRSIENLVRKGRLTREGGALRIPKPAWLFADDTAARLF
jgi:oxygen-independent coproporphyrinogen-3 oxidase